MSINPMGVLGSDVSLKTAVLSCVPVIGRAAEATVGQKIKEQTKVVKQMEALIQIQASTSKLSTGLFAMKTGAQVLGRQKIDINELKKQKDNILQSASEIEQNVGKLAEAKKQVIRNCVVVSGTSTVRYGVPLLAATALVATGAVTNPIFLGLTAWQGWATLKSSQGLAFSITSLNKLEADSPKQIDDDWVEV
ncbi:MAG: hypothetical protein V4487_02595 [Chlamydiota bacterium]